MGPIKNLTSFLKINLTHVEHHQEAQIPNIPRLAVSQLPFDFKKCWYIHADATLKRKRESYREVQVRIALK